MDSLYISTIRAYGYTGVLPEEQALGQWFEVDLKLDLDLSQAGNSDRLEDTYDYSVTVLAVQTLIQTSRFQLIEKLADAVAQLVLNTDRPALLPPIQQVQVRLTKLTPPIPNFSGTVTVEISRSSLRSLP